MIQDKRRGDTAGPAVTVKPEPLAALQARFPATLAPIYDEEEINLGTVIPPGEKPEHIFDFESGTRLIVSRTRMTSGRVETHFSCSCLPGSKDDTYLHKLAGLRPKEIALAGVVGFFMACWMKISGSQQAVEFTGFSDGKMVPHFRVIGKEEWQ